MTGKPAHVTGSAQPRQPNVPAGRSLPAALRAGRVCPWRPTGRDDHAPHHERQPGMSEKVQTIQHGMFIMPFHPPSKPLVQCYEEDLELIVRAEELGFSEFWIGEHHTMKYENIVMPEIFIARALGETKRIRMGPAPVCLNQHHPAHVASRLAFLDHLSKGRLNLCFGSGSVSADQELYGADPKQAAAIVDEATQMHLQLWTSEPPYELARKAGTAPRTTSHDEERGIGSTHQPLPNRRPPGDGPA